MDLGLEKAVVIVTGASSGIGRATAIAFGGEHARVVVTFNTKEEAAQATAAAVRARGGEAMVAQLTLESRGAPEALVARVRETWGDVHVVVNNAVRWPAGFFSVEQLPLEELELSLRANVVGPIALVKAALPSMRAAGWGRVVTVSTGLVVDGSSGATAYVAAKGAMHAFHRTLAKEVGSQNILANVLMAGAVDSEVRHRPKEMLESMAAAATTGRLTLAEDVARAAVFLGSPANGHLHGEAVRVDGFFVTPVRWSPPRAT